VAIFDLFLCFSNRLYSLKTMKKSLSTLSQRLFREKSDPNYPVEERLCVLIGQCVSLGPSSILAEFSPLFNFPELGNGACCSIFIIFKEI